MAAALFVTGTVLFGGAPAAWAYSGQGAANYADTYAINNNVAFVSYSDDCTNFVSQALWKGGGKAFRGTPTQYVTNNDNQWWTYAGYGLPYNSSRTVSWSVANQLDDFLAHYDPNSGTNQFQPSASLGDYSPAGIVTGDPIFYDQHYASGHGWANIDHAAIQVGTGYDAYGQYGNLVDEHTNNRKRVIWNLNDVNSQWATTATYEVHVG